MNVNTRELLDKINQITSNMDGKFLLLHAGEAYTLRLDALHHEVSGKYMLPCTYCRAINLVDLLMALRIVTPRFRRTAFRCHSCGHVNYVFLTIDNNVHVDRVSEIDNG